MRQQHRFLCLSPAIHHYRSAFLVSAQDGIQSPHRAEKYKFLSIS